MSEQRWGASPDDWVDLAVVAGLEEDLLPVVSNPGARIDPDSKLKTLGKVPSLYNPAGLVVGIGKWTEKRATARDIDRWSAQADYGICIQTRVVRALDVDIDDPEVAGQVFAVISRHFGSLPVRERDDSAKFLTAFTMPGDFTKRILKTRHGAVEFLANGQQFIACGTHPKGARYRWQAGTPYDFPTITREAFEACWAELLAQFGIEEVIEYNAAKALKEVRRAVDVPDQVADFLIEKGWVLSSTRDGRLNITCPFEHEHSGPSADDTATQYMPKGVGGFEQGHFHCLHAHCAGRNDGEFLQQIGVYADAFDIVEAEPGDGPEPPPFQRDLKSGEFLTTIHNVMLALNATEWLGVEIVRDDFRDELMIGPPGKGKWRAFDDADYLRLRLQLERRGIAVGAELMREAVNLRATENRVDTAIAWLENEVPAWDGVPRIESFYSRVFGVPDDEYARAVGLYTWTAMAGRVLSPGCKVDMVPILSGAQGLGKSRVVAAMVPNHAFFAELDLSERDDNMSRLMRGKLVAELGELKGLHNRDVEAVKAFVTRQHESWVPKYKEFATTFPRRLIFIGTTNRAEFLADETGNRRWLPMTVVRADADLVAQERDQLWAEGRERFRKDGVLFAQAQRLAEARHADYRIHDSWEEVVREWLESMDDITGCAHGEMPLRARDVLVGALRIEPRAIKRGDEMRVGGVLRALGYERRVMKVAKNNAKVWVRNPATATTW